MPNGRSRLTDNERMCGIFRPKPPVFRSNRHVGSNLTLVRQFFCGGEIDWLNGQSISPSKIGRGDGDGAVPLPRIFFKMVKRCIVVHFRSILKAFSVNIVVVFSLELRTVVVWLEQRVAVDQAPGDECLD